MRDSAKTQQPFVFAVLGAWTYEKPRFEDRSGGSGMRNEGIGKNVTGINIIEFSRKPILVVLSSRSSDRHSGI